MKPGLALRVLSVGVAVFLFAMALNKVAWIGDPDQLAQRFQRWLPNAAPYARWYLQSIAIPGAPVFARLVPIGEFAVAVALLLGVRTNVAAMVSLFMVLNFHLATSAFSSWEFLRDASGPPVIGALLALAIAGRRLPFSLPVGR
ncbi:MAG: DoxX family membrane protein [Vicinamibacterales bacterium]